MAFSVYRNGKYGRSRSAAVRLRWRVSRQPNVPPQTRTRCRPSSVPPTMVEQALNDAHSGLNPAVSAEPRSYTPRMFLEALGTPYLSTGGGPFGNFVRGGGSMLFSDLLGERKVALFAQAGDRLRDFALGVQYLNRGTALDWGGVAEVQPSAAPICRERGSPNQETGPAVTRETQVLRARPRSSWPGRPRLL